MSSSSTLAQSKLLGIRRRLAGATTELVRPDRAWNVCTTVVDAIAAYNSAGRLLYQVGW
jgi:hypothetical protein